MSEELTERQAFLILNALPNIGPITTNRLLAEFGGDPRVIFSTGSQRLGSVKGVGPVISATLAGWRGHFDLAREEEKIAKTSAEFITTR
ncbi:MAG TPA: DNA-protecting protein DprA, partial [Opitutaceae bacterium]|nr:DNA-protecting protein DprA [Opitutaceae bacterium]